jgi:hypothetical protein
MEDASYTGSVTREKMMRFLFLTMLVCFRGMADEMPCRFPYWSNLADALSDPTRVTNILLKTDKEDCSDARRFYRIAEETFTEWKKSQKPAPEQIRLAMVLKQKHSDGAFAEGLNEYLGDAMEKRPLEFLTEAKDSLPNDKWCTAGMVANFGDYGAMSEGEKKKRLAARRKALRTVTDSNLKKIVLQCLSVIPR